MLKYRLLTAALLIPLVVLVIWFLPMPWFAILMGLLMAWGAWEWSLLFNWQDPRWRIGYVMVVALALWGAYFLPVQWVLMVAGLAWLWALAAVLCYQHEKAPLGFQYVWVKAVMGVLVLASAWMSVNVLREEVGGPGWLLFGLVLIWVLDSSAYVVGKVWGKHPWLTRISPHKTWEGFYGGIAVAWAVALIICLVFHTPFYRSLVILGISLITLLFAVIGDLFESMLKRQAGLKDSGRGLPGHGGLLDRLDSTLAALPIFALGSMLLSVLITNIS